MKTLKKEYLEVLENLGWLVEEYDNEGHVTLLASTPYGEEFDITVSVDDFPGMVEDTYLDFDVEEHVFELLKEKRMGLDGIPFVTEIVESAVKIKDMLEELSEAIY